MNTDGLLFEGSRPPLPGAGGGRGPESGHVESNERGIHLNESQFFSSGSTVCVSALCTRTWPMLFSPVEASTVSSLRRPTDQDSLLMQTAHVRSMKAAGPMQKRSSRRSQIEHKDRADAALYWKAYAENKEGQQARALETCADLGRHSSAELLDQASATPSALRFAAGVGSRYRRNPRRTMI